MNVIQNLVNNHTKIYPDYPQPGIMFKDLSPLFTNPLAVRFVADDIIAKVPAFYKLISLESRGFIVGAVISQICGVDMVMARKKGKLPGELVSYEYSLEYGTKQCLELQKSQINPGDIVHIHDDILATGGTALAAYELVKQCGGLVSGFSFINEISDLKGRERLEEFAPVYSITID